MADKIATAVIVQDDDYLPILAESYIPEGFHWIGSGSERHCFLGPDGIVYKITLDDPRAKYSNSSEWNIFCESAKVLPPAVRFAECFLWFSGEVDVLAMEYVEGVGEGESMWDHPGLAALVKMGWADAHEYNCSILNGTLILIDYAR